MTGVNLTLLASLGLHGLALKLPILSPQPAPPELDVPESLPVAVLPAPQPIPAPLPQGTPQPALPQSAAPNAPAPRPAQLAAAPATSAPPPAQAPSPAATPEPPSAPIVPNPPPPPPTEQPVVPYADFPHLIGATAGCQGLAECWRSPAGSWRTAAADLRSQLEAQGYTLENITEQILSDDTGTRIYEVAHPEKPTYYLHFVSVAGGVLYAMAEKPMAEDAIAAIEKF